MFTSWILLKLKNTLYTHTHDTHTHNCKHTYVLPWNDWNIVFSWWTPVGARVCLEPVRLLRWQMHLLPTLKIHSVLCLRAHALTFTLRNAMLGGSRSRGSYQSSINLFLSSHAWLFWTGIKQRAGFKPSINLLTFPQMLISSDVATGSNAHCSERWTRVTCMGRSLHTQTCLS